MGSHWIEGFQPVVGCIGLTKPPYARPGRTVWKPVPARVAAPHMERHLPSAVSFHDGTAA
jgi:hypothetical protein